MGQAAKNLRQERRHCFGFQRRRQRAGHQQTIAHGDETGGNSGQDVDLLRDFLRRPILLCRLAKDFAERIGRGRCRRGRRRDHCRRRRRSRRNHRAGGAGAGTGAGAIGPAGLPGTAKRLGTFSPTATVFCMTGLLCCAMKSGAITFSGSSKDVSRCAWQRARN